MTYNLQNLKNKYRNIFYSYNIVYLKNFLNYEEANKINNFGNTVEKKFDINLREKLFNENNINLKNNTTYFINKNKNISKFLEYKINPLINNIYGKELTIFRDKMYLTLPNEYGIKGQCDILKYDNYKPKNFVNILLFPDSNTINFSYNYEIDKKDFVNGEMNPIIENILYWDNIKVTPRDIIMFNSNKIY